MYHPLVAMETGFASRNGILSKAQGLNYSKLCLNPDIFPELKESEYQEKNIYHYQRKLKKWYRATLTVLMYNFKSKKQLLRTVLLWLLRICSQDSPRNCGFLRTWLPVSKAFLGGLWQCGKSRSWQGLLFSPQFNCPWTQIKKPF